MTPYAHWTADSGTHELPRLHRGRPVEYHDTVELHLLDLRPTVTRYSRPSRARRFATSAYLADVRARLPLILEVLGAVGVVCLGIVLLRGLAVAATIAGLR